jgi:peptidoglycan/LPS O-acetylase OafA/YrhL
MERMNAAQVDAARARRRQRRRFAALLAPVALALIVAGGLFGDEDGALGAVGLAALAQGIGLAVALVWLAGGHNPLSKR